ncbi:MAG: hypothetical protein AMJ90_09365 [candidate division Zixibacteria bacterium SM23_73_2]|nr:MAG: hypothetical protein AMJ90_09365 [candidate division Zixibacteria bacterium SM23_73_2]
MSVGKKKVLVISYYFPPLGMAGVQRMAKFVKYLPTFGWEPVVLTVKDIEYFAKDPSLLDDIPKDIKVFKTGSFDPLRVSLLLKKLFKEKRNSKRKATYTKGFSLLAPWIFFPDSKIGWLPFALAKGLSIVKKEKIDLIFSSSPPPTAHLVAHYLKILTGKKWVADFRDLLFGYGYKHCPTFFHRVLKEKTQRVIFKNSDRIITENDKIADRVKGRNFRVCDIDVIPNGYDQEDFSFQPEEKKEYFKIVYCGSLSPDSKPEPFFGALSDLIKEGKSKGSKIKFVHVGNFFGIDLDHLVKKYRLAESVLRVGYLPHKRALKEMTSADLLLILVSEEKDSENIIPGKIFEYLYSKKPILAVVPPSGAIGEMVRRFKRGRVISPKNTNEIKEAIRSFLLRKEELPLLEEKDIMIFQRRYLTSRLAQIFDNLLG